VRLFICSRSLFSLFFINAPWLSGWVDGARALIASLGESAFRYATRSLVPQIDVFVKCMHIFLCVYREGVKRARAHIIFHSGLLVFLPLLRFSITQFIFLSTLNFRGHGIMFCFIPLYSYNYYKMKIITERCFFVWICANPIFFIILAELLKFLHKFLDDLFKCY
jgi:hypothetical protein